MVLEKPGIEPATPTWTNSSNILLYGIVLSFITLEYDFLSVTIHINCSAARCLKTLSISPNVPLSGYDDVALFEWRRQWRWMDTKNRSLRLVWRVNQLGKLINGIPGSRLLISWLPGSAWLATQASRCQQAFSKPCLVNLISKDTHLVFFMNWTGKEGFSKLFHFSDVFSEHVLSEINSIRW